MIKLIGVKRAIVLGVVLSVNLLVGAVWFLGVDPLRQETSDKLAAVSGKISQASSDIQNVKTVLAAYKGNYAKYHDLESRGFFSKQDRFEAGRLLDDLRPKAGVIGYSYKLDSIKTVQNTDAEAAGDTLIDTKISLERITSVTDTNIYALIGHFSTSFPPHARLSKFEIKRSKDVNASSLKELTNGPVPFVDATMEVDWLTLVPKQNTSPATAPGQPGGFRGR